MEDLSRFERDNDQDDFHHRMKMNALAGAAVLVLVFLGIWLADQLAQIRKDQDCVLSGRRACVPIEVPAHPR